MDDAQHAVGEVVPTAVVVDDFSGRHRAKRQCQSIDGEIPAAQVVGQRLAPVTGNVDRHPGLPDKDTPDVAALVHREPGLSQLLCQLLRQTDRIPGYDQVDVMVGAAEQGIAHDPADQVNRPAGLGQQRRDAVEQGVEGEGHGGSQEGAGSSIP